MEQYAQFLFKHKLQVIILFVLAAAVCAVLSGMTGVNYKLTDYLPKDAASVRALAVMEEEYNQSVPSLRVLIYDVSIPEALSYKERLAAIDGVEEVTWLDDVVNLYEPLEMADRKTVEEYYKEPDACFYITVSETKEEAAVSAIREAIGETNCMSGSAAESVMAARDTAKEMRKVMLAAVAAVLLVLLVSTDSWIEPVLLMVTAGVAVLLNMGTNLIFDTVSFVTSAAVPVLQLATSIGCSGILLQQFSEKREVGLKREEAMAAAMSRSAGSILFRGLAAGMGFLALACMSFRIGPDLGWAMIKAVVFSLLTTLCFLPALALAACPLIDRARHRSLLPKAGWISGFVMKAGVPILILSLVMSPVMFLARQNNRFFYGGSEVYAGRETQLGRDSQAIEEVFGVSNPVVLMVPKGEPERETAMNEELLELDYVTSVVSYVNSVGSAVPDGFVPSDTLSSLYSAHYSRFVITLDVLESEMGWEDKVNAVRNIGEKYYGTQLQYAGDLVSTADLKSTVTADGRKVNLLAIGLVLVLLLVHFRSLSLPLILVLIIEASVWINLGIPYFSGRPLFYLVYLIIHAVQLGVTMDYAMLFTERYLDSRKRLPKKQAAKKTLEACIPPLLTSAVVLALAGCILGRISTNGVLSQLGWLTGMGAALSLVMVLFVLPVLLRLFDGVIRRTTLHAGFYGKRQEESVKGEEPETDGMDNAMMP